MKVDEEKQIKEAFEKITEGIESSPPNLATLSMMLNKKKSEHKRRLNRELMFFMLIASFCIIILTLVLANAPTLYIGIQVLGIVSVPCVMIWRNKKSEQGDSVL